MAIYRFGKLAAKRDERTLKFADYLTPELPPPPIATNNLARVYANLKTSDPKVLFPMDGNDTEGDCTLAAAAHAMTVWNGILGKQRIMAAKDVVAAYRHLAGGQDTGLVESDVLKFWRKHGFGGRLPLGIGSEKILAWVDVDPKNHEHVQQAINLFHGLYIGFNVEQNCINDFQARKPWMPGPLLNEGHAIFIVDYDQAMLNSLTWGDTQDGTWAWWDACVDEAHAIIPIEAKQPGFTPGFNFAQLEADLAAVTN